MPTASLFRRIIRRDRLRTSPVSMSAPWRRPSCGWSINGPKARFSMRWSEARPRRSWKARLWCRARPASALRSISPWRGRILAYRCLGMPISTNAWVDDDTSVRRLRFAPDQDDGSRDQSGHGRRRAPAFAVARLSAHACDVAQDRAAVGAAFHGRLSRSARLWRLRKARGSQVAYQLFETCDGAGQGRSNAGDRLL